METDHRKTYTDIICLHEEAEKTQNEGHLMALGIKAREATATSHGRVVFRPSFFHPARPQGSFQRGSRRASSSSTSQSPSSSSCEANEKEEGRDKHNVPETIYPPLLKRCAQIHGRTLPTPRAGPPSSLQGNGATQKGKWREDPTLGLREERNGRCLWEISQVFEDHTHCRPHAVIELFAERQTLKGIFALTLHEIKAILRVMRVRMAMSHYGQHWNLPILVLSYLGLRWGRILQAHHNGHHLVIQCSQIFDLENAKAGPAALDTFLRYYSCEPTWELTQSKHEREPQSVPRKWYGLGKRRRADEDEAAPVPS